MQAWLRISMLLCSFGFFRELRPSEPFVTEFLSGEWRNITVDQVNQEIYPLGTYSVLAQLIIVFLVTDILRYKPIIVLSAFAGIALFGIMLWTKSLWELQLGQLFYGTFTASEVAYYTYIYAKVDKERYQIVTGHTRSAILCGKFLGGVLAQILVSTSTMNYRELNYISFATQIVSLLIAITLPNVKRSLYFYSLPSQEGDSQLENKNAQSSEDGHSKPTTVEDFDSPEASHGHSNAVVVHQKEQVPIFSWNKAMKLLWQHTRTAYTNPTIVQWSLWWALATCGQAQVVAYIQFLWKDINENNESFYNGGVEATVTLLGALGAIAAGLINSKQYRRWHIWIITICTLFMSGFVLWAATTRLLWVAYVMYIFFGIFYFFIITIGSATVAENLSDDSFGLIFGINTLVALVLQTILTLVVVTDNVGYGLRPRGQYLVYGIYFAVISILYCIIAIVRSCLTRSNSENHAANNLD